MVRWLEKGLLVSMWKNNSSVVLLFPCPPPHYYYYFILKPPIKVGYTIDRLQRNFLYLGVGEWKRDHFKDQCLS